LTTLSLESNGFSAKDCQKNAGKENIPPAIQDSGCIYPQTRPGGASQYRESSEGNFYPSYGEDDSFGDVYVKIESPPLANEALKDCRVSRATPAIDYGDNGSGQLEECQNRDDIRTTEGAPYVSGSTNVSTNNNGTRSWNPDVPIPSIEKDDEEVERAKDYREISSAEASSRMSLRTAVAYGVSSGLFQAPKTKHHGWPANRTSRNLRTTHDLALTPSENSYLPTLNSFGMRLLQSSNQSSKIDLLGTSSRNIPIGLRKQFDALRAKYESDISFRDSVNTYIMEVTSK
jgi:hypothetical protein